MFAEIIDCLHASADLLSLHITDTTSTSQLRQFHMTKASLEVDLALFHDRGESDEDILTLIKAVNLVYLRLQVRVEAQLYYS